MDYEPISWEDEESLRNGDGPFYDQSSNVIMGLLGRIDKLRAGNAELTRKCMECGKANGELGIAHVEALGEIEQLEQKIEEYKQALIKQSISIG